MTVLIGLNLEMFRHIVRAYPDIKPRGLQAAMGRRWRYGEGGSTGRAGEVGWKWWWWGGGCGWCNVVVKRVSTGFNKCLCNILRTLLAHVCV